MRRKIYEDTGFGVLQPLEAPSGQMWIIMISKKTDDKRMRTGVGNDLEHHPKKNPNPPSPVSTSYTQHSLIEHIRS